jgi:hypothetical protein
MLLGPALPARCREDTVTGKQCGCLVLPHTTLGEVSGGSDAAGRRVMQIAAGFARTRRERLSFPGFPD